MGFVTKIFFLSLRAPFWVGKIGAAGVCLFPFDQVEPAEAVLRTHGRVLNSSSGAAVALRQPPKHFRFSCFEKIQLLFFFPPPLFGQPGGQICSHLLQVPPRNTGKRLVSLALPGLLPSPSSRQLFSVRVAALRPLQASHECFFQSIHINRGSCVTHIFSFAPAAASSRWCVNPSVRLSLSCIVRFVHGGLCTDCVLIDYPAQ